MERAQLQEHQQSERRDESGNTLSGVLDANVLNLIQDQLERMQIQQTELQQQVNARLDELSQKVTTKSSGISQPPPAYPSMCRGSTYFFNVRNLADRPVQVTTTYSPDWYVHHLGFRAAYYFLRHGKILIASLNLCYYGREGPSHTKVRVRISLVSWSDDSDDWVLYEQSGVIENSKVSLNKWARGFSAEVSMSKLIDHGYLTENRGLVLKYDIDLME